MRRALSGGEACCVGDCFLRFAVFEITTVRANASKETEIREKVFHGESGADRASAQNHRRGDSCGVSRVRHDGRVNTRCSRLARVDCRLKKELVLQLKRRHAAAGMLCRADGSVGEKREFKTPLKRRNTRALARPNDPCRCELHQAGWTRVETTPSDPSIFCAAETTFSSLSQHNLHGHPAKGPVVCHVPPALRCESAHRQCAI